MEICNIYYNGIKILEIENEGRGWGRIKIIFKFIVLVIKNMFVLLVKREKGDVESGIWGGRCWIWDVKCEY